MNDHLAYGVEFAITQSDLVLLEKGPQHIPMSHLSKIEVKGRLPAPDASDNTPEKTSTATYVVGAVALLCLLLGWTIVGLLLGAVAAYLFFRSPSKLHIYRAYAWTNGMSDADASFHVANHEMLMLKNAMSHFPDVKLQFGSEIVSGPGSVANGAGSGHSSEDVPAPGPTGGSTAPQSQEVPEPDPHDADANRNAARQLFDIDPVRHADRILPYVENVLRIVPGDEIAHETKVATLLAVGHHAWNMEDWSAATDAFAKAYAGYPIVEQLPEALVYCAREGGLLPQAIAVLEARIADEPDDLTARRLAGRSYARIATDSEALSAAGTTLDEVLDRAEAHLLFVTEREPDNEEANYWLACVFVMLAKVDEAWAQIEILKRTSPERAGHIEEMLTA